MAIEITMHVTCPTCVTEFPIEAGFADDDGKRLALVFADLDPAVGRALISYLRLFKPPKTKLRTARAYAIALEVAELVKATHVTIDHLRAPASPAIWAKAMMLMVEDRDLVTPIASHAYLRKVVYTIANSDEAKAERAREEAARRGQANTDGGRRRELLERLSRVDSDVQLGLLSPEDAERKRAAVRQEFAT